MSSQYEQRARITPSVRYNENWFVVRTKAKCPKCHSEVITELSKNRDVMVKYCSNEHCDYGLSKNGEFV